MFNKKVSLYLASAVLPTIFALPAQASQLDFALSEEAASLEAHVDTNALNGGGAQVSVGGIYNEDDDIAGFIGFSSRGSNDYNASNAYTFGVGVRGYYAALDDLDKNVGAVALGVNGKLRFNAGIPLAVTGELYYAPKITTFDDGDDLLDTRIRLETDVSQNARAFVGYRTLQTELKSGGDYEIDDQLQLGINFDF